MEISRSGKIQEITTTPIGAIFMNSKTLMLLCTLAVTTFSYSAFSQESSVCADPLQKICKETEGLRSQREGYVNQLKAEIGKEASANAAPRIADMKSKVSKFKLIKRMIETYKINNQEIMKAAKKRVVGLESVVTNPETVALLRGYMDQAISESHFDEATKVGLKGIMAQVIIGNFADFLEKTGLEESALGQLLNNPCGSDGLVDNAFATEINKQKYVLICPGFLVTLTQTPDLRERFNSILHAISHEMGHHIDNSKVGNQLYAPFLICLAQNHADRFNLTKEDEKFCKKNTDKPGACAVQTTISHAGELIADAWGIKVLNIHARKQGYSFQETNSLLTDSWSKLCGTGDEGIHPSGDFRIGTLLRMDPDMSSYLACDNSAINSKPACTLEGAVNI